ncbi:hypothetical protein GPECTOR_11g19 [Gonium pectorale]|uniref:Uncharacterized protein n=1 Tax=Gonium pectorale TaxID=33097 RepID=A0A150GPJ0_GONPE|nr:hypothetical protein GPECTOR_11g19 [Gonium pectorale]|eukprot:KXZ51743.1 hypothetical protein GPECTOR_11g19 [Gonium pectorale]
MAMQGRELAEGLKGRFQDSLDGSIVGLSPGLENDVASVLQQQQRTEAAFVEYENRVLSLELQGLVDRWRALDIDELSQQNHELREECMRLQRENMELSRAVAESSLSARRDLAKIEMALEMTVKAKMKEVHDKVRQELYDELDEKTKKMADRTRLKVDADVATSLSEQQALQVVGLRRQLQEAYRAVDVLRRRLVDSEARGQAAWDEAVRASSRAAVAAAAAARAGLRAGPGPERDAALQQLQGEADGDSAYGMAGEGAEVAALESQLRHAKQRFERMRLQRDRWRDRSLLFERACAQLQAALQGLQDASRCKLPGGVQQDLDAICSGALQPGLPAAAGGPSPLPEVGLGGGALYTAVYTIAASSGHAGTHSASGAGAGAGASGGNGAVSSLPGIPSAGSEVSVSVGGGAAAATAGRLQPLTHHQQQHNHLHQKQEQQHLGPLSLPAASHFSAAAASAAGLGTGAVSALVTVTTPSAMLAALRRPPSAFRRLGSADVLFAGARAATPRGGRPLRSSGAASARGGGGAGAVGGGVGTSSGAGDGAASLSGM